MPRHLLAALTLLAACETTPGDPPDAHPAPADASAATDSTPADAAPRADADPAACDPTRTLNYLADRPMAEGDYCDDIQVCAPDAETAAAIMAAAPGFTCGEPGQGCPGQGIGCQWSDAGEIDADEWAQICEITVLPEAPLMTCWIYV